MTNPQNGDCNSVTADTNEDIMEDMSVKSIDDDEVDTIIEEDVMREGDLIEMDDVEDNMEKYIEEDMDGATVNYDDLVVEDDGESLSNGAIVTTTTKATDVDGDDALVEEAEVEAAEANGHKPVVDATPVVAAKPARQQHKEESVVESNGFVERVTQINNDDDRPVSIPSDSDGEEEQPTRPRNVATNPSSLQNGTKEADEIHEVLSDKEEDCVMLDDTPPPKVAPSATRKSIPARPKPPMDYDDDIQEIIDDPIPINSTTTIQPVSKKMKLNSGNATSGGSTSLLSKNQLAGLPADLSITAGTTITKNSGKFSFVDPKSLMNPAKTQMGDVTNLLAGGGLTISQVTPGSVTSGSGGAPSESSMRATITPVNSNNANPSGSVSGSSSKSAASAQNKSTAPVGLGDILLPALTDDMFVLEAPSFIVPYIYEKPPTENLRTVVNEMKKELDALKAAEDAKKAVKESPAKEKSIKVDDPECDTGEDKEKDNEDGTKKKKGSKGDQKNPDDSWGESDESTDDEASDSETRTKVLIKDVEPKIMESMLLPGGPDKKIGVDGQPMAGTDSYFESPLGQFFMGIGMNMVQEHVQADLLRMQTRKQQREGGKQNIHLQTAINNLMQNLESSRKDNEPFKFPAKRCDFCSFKTESGLVIASHYEKPHLKGNAYKCNFCEFEARPAHDILYHMEAVHNMKSKLEKPLSYHQCPNCPFEDNGKSKLARHALACAKKFVPEKNLLPMQDWDPPAKIPRVKPRHGLVGTATAYQAMAAQQQRIQAATGMMNRTNPGANNNAAMTANAALSLLTANAALLTNNMAMNLAGQAAGGKFRNKGNNQKSASRSSNNAQQQMANALMLQNNFNQLAAVAAAAKNFNSSQLLQMASQAGMLPNAHSSLTIQQSNQGQQGNKSSKNVQQPSISITPLPRQGSSGGSGGSAASGTGNNSGRGMEDGLPSNLPKPGQHPSGAKTSFVMCEICDGYIKDLDQLRSHMQMIHKVKIHPKMIYNRPPLNCQKCQYRFFTDQGLERHLLGSHGLVTSSMQEAANCGQDSGRCPICGRVYQWKLLNHVSRDHNMTLKPAHLSYKCTVCTATFGMYKQFENHVYSAHSTVAKKSGDKKNSSSTGGDSSSKPSLPIKINDEITIIPQPPSKMSKTPHTIEIE